MARPKKLGADHEIKRLVPMAIHRREAEGAQFAPSGPVQTMTGAKMARILYPPFRIANSDQPESGNPGAPCAREGGYFRTLQPYLGAQA